MDNLYKLSKLQFSVPTIISLCSHYDLNIRLEENWYMYVVCDLEKIRKI